MIRLRHILYEQTANPKQLANAIFNAKGYTYDNEQDAINAVLSITSYQQFKAVEKYFINVSGGRSIPEYLISFLEDFRENLKVIKHLYSVFKSNEIALQSVIYPYAAQLILEYSLDIAKVGVAIRKQRGNTKPITRKNYSEAVLWFKPYLGDANYNRWVAIKQSGKYDRAFNANAEEEKFMYDTSKIVSSDLILGGQLIVGVLATAATAGGAAPATAAWIGATTAAGIGWADATQEWKLGNKTTAGILAVIELLPIISKIPAVKELVKTAGKSVARKLASGITKFTGEEKLLVRELFLNKSKLAKELKKVKGNFPDKLKSLPNANSDIKLNRAYEVPGSPDATIGVYGRSAASGDAWVAMADRNFKEFTNYVTYQRIFKNGIPTNELSMKTALETAPPGTFKNIMNRMAKILPDHVLIEKTSISTDGIMMWFNQIKNGYKPLTETFTVPINSAGKKTKLPGVISGQFDNMTFNEETSKIALKQINELIKDIPNSSAKITKISKPPAPVFPKSATGLPLPLPKSNMAVYEILVTLPKLQSTTKSLTNLGIKLDMISAPLLKTIYNKQSS